MITALGKYQGSECSGNPNERAKKKKRRLRKRRNYILAPLRDPVRRWGRIHARSRARRLWSVSRASGNSSPYLLPDPPTRAVVFSSEDHLLKLLPSLPLPVLVGLDRCTLTDDRELTHLAASADGSLNGAHPMCVVPQGGPCLRSDCCASCCPRRVGRDDQGASSIAFAARASSWPGEGNGYIECCGHLLNDRATRPRSRPSIYSYDCA